jgi:hypothetical protein
MAWPCRSYRANRDELIRKRSLVQVQVAARHLAGARVSILRGAVLPATNITGSGRSAR